MATFKLPSGGFVGGEVRVIGKEIIEAKLAAAEANILKNNVAMTTEMLRFVKAEVVANTPLGPGHFGYHLRDSLKTYLTIGFSQAGTGVVGLLKSPPTGYWREYGTGLRYRGPKKAAASVRALTGQAGTGGERAFGTAHHALAGIRKFINFYYGGLARWWHA